MILAFALLLAQAAPELGVLPPQTLAKGQCAMFLWDRSSGERIAMVRGGGGTMLLQRKAGPAVLAAEAAAPANAETPPVLGFAPRARFADGEGSAAIDLVITANQGGPGATVRDGVLTITGQDGVALVVPVAGLIGCV